MGLRAYFYLALAQYLAGEWDDVLLTAEQGFSAAAIHSRRFELPLLHLAAGCVPAGRGAAEEAERHARLAEEAAASMDYGQERVYAGMARALVCQAAGDYLGMADALGAWQDDAALDGRSRVYAVLWRPLLAEGLVGSGQLEPAAAVLGQLRADSGQVSYLRPAVAWLEGWLAEQRGAAAARWRFTRAVRRAAGLRSPVHDGRLLLAHGRLLRRTGQRRLAVERLRQASDLYHALRAEPFIARAEEELAACHLPGSPAKKQSVLTLTSRETEVAHLVGKGLSNPEIAAELFISRKAVEYHLGNIYAKCGLHGRQQLRRFVEQWGQPPPSNGRLTDQAAGLWPGPGPAAVGREGPGQRLGDQAGARRVASRGVVDAVGDEPAVLGRRGPVVDAHVRVAGAGLEQRLSHASMLLSAYGPVASSDFTFTHMTGWSPISDIISLIRVARLTGEPTARQRRRWCPGPAPSSPGIPAVPAAGRRCRRSAGPRTSRRSTGRPRSPG